MLIDRDFGELFSGSGKGADQAERRTDTRAIVLVAAAVSYDGGELSATCRELSASGVFLATPHTLSVGTRVALAISLPNGSISVTGHVRWTTSDADEMAGLGVELCDVSEPALQTIAAFHAAKSRVTG